MAYVSHFVSVCKEPLELVSVKSLLSLLLKVNGKEQPVDSWFPSISFSLSFLSSYGVSDLGKLVPSSCSQASSVAPDVLAVRSPLRRHRYLIRVSPGPTSFRRSLRGALVPLTCAEVTQVVTGYYASTAPVGGGGRATSVPLTC